jgi:two-component system nitrogen regulation response regulator GlnG
LTTKHIVLVGHDEASERHLSKRLKQYRIERVGNLNAVDLDSPPDLVVYEPEGELDQPASDGLRRLAEQHVPFIMISEIETMKSTVKAISLGAYDYLLRSDDREAVVDAVLACLEPPRAVVPAEYLDEDVDFEDFMIGRSAKIQEVFKLIGKIAESNVSVLLRGESGTGKELVARQIHKNSARRTHPFVCIDCASIPRELVENELFGHEAGAYSGAETRATGKFDGADHGTVFLDEVSEMDLELQSKILRVIQENQFDRVGGSRPVKVDVRIIVATQANLEQQVRSGRFRADLYHRLNVITLYLPPLRERTEDIPVLAHHFVNKHCKLLGLPVKQIGADFMRTLERYEWPGNVRELENLIRRGLLLERGDVITGRFLELCQGVEQGPYDEDSLSFNRLISDRFLTSELNWKRNDVYRQMTNKIERMLLKLVLAETHGNQVSASRLLGISRNTLRVKMQELGLSSGAFK